MQRLVPRADYLYNFCHVALQPVVVEWAFLILVCGDLMLRALFLHHFIQVLRLRENSIELAGYLIVFLNQSIVALSQLQQAGLCLAASSFHGQFEAQPVPDELLDACHLTQALLKLLLQSLLAGIFGGNQLRLQSVIPKLQFVQLRL